MSDKWMETIDMPDVPHVYWCEQLGVRVVSQKCSDASVRIHPERHRRCGWYMVMPDGSLGLRKKGG